MEILNAHPSLRDSKTYINSFGPRPAKPHAEGQPISPPSRKAGFPFNVDASRSPSAARTASAPKPLTRPAGRASGKETSHLPRMELERIVRSVGSEGQHQDAEADGIASDSHHFAQPDYAVRSLPDTALAHSELQKPVRAASQAALAEQLSSPPVQQHTALVKVQGPFTARQMESIAEGMVYLKRLGLVSVVVLDSEDPAWRLSVSDFSPKDGKRMEADGDGDLGPWMAARSSEASRTSSVGKLQEVLRKQMLSFATQLSELLTDKGAAARPFTHAMMRVDADAVLRTDASNPPHLTDCPSTAGRQFQWGVKRPSISSRSPLVSDDGLTSVRRALANDMIPVIAPLALYSDPDAQGAPRTVCVRSDDVVVGLAREMAAEGKAVEARVEATGEMPAEAVDMMPLRLMVINREGGIPSHARGGNPHLSINLASEYSHITHSFIWDESHPTALSNLCMVRDCLAFMPHTSSGVVVSHRSPKSLIANLITNKAAHSPSLPHRLLAGREDVRHTPTIIRPGLPVRVLSAFDRVDWSKMTQLLEQSFGRQLEAQAYYERLSKCLDFVIVMGDYQGAAIVTHEFAPGEDVGTHETIAYLDKFAVLPNLQGSGAVDFLWGALRDEVHGLGLLDALNDNGGKGGFGSGRDLVWKSRSTNPVNKWYFERSNGFLRIGEAWTMFWADAEQRLAIMSGERRLGAEASAQEILDLAREGPDERRPAWNDQEEAREDSVRRAQSLMYAPGELGQLHRGDSQRLLPVIAPNEEGRLERWARCMASIPSAWR